MKTMEKQKGFTIIELVVVILLLGILTATALPRFMDVTEEAHSAVVDATLSGIGTGAAMFRAQWVAQAETTSAITEFGGNFAHTTSGYPIGTAASGTAFADDDDCVNMATGLLQTMNAVTFAGLGGASNAGAGTGVGAAAALPANANADYIVVAPADATDTCEFWYVGETRGSLVAKPVLTYDAGAGTIIRSSLTPAS